MGATLVECKGELGQYVALMPCTYSLGTRRGCSVAAASVLDCVNDDDRFYAW